MATSSSVVFPRAESTATTRLPCSLRWTIRPAAALTRSASPTDVPPNFITTVSPASGMASKDSLGAGAPIQKPAGARRACRRRRGGARRRNRRGWGRRQERPRAPFGPICAARLVPGTDRPATRGPAASCRGTRAAEHRPPGPPAPTRPEGGAALPLGLPGSGPDLGHIHATQAHGPRRDRLRASELPRLAAALPAGGRGGRHLAAGEARAALGDGAAAGRRV